MKSRSVVNSILFSVLAFIVISLCAPLMADNEDEHYVQSDEYFIGYEKFALPWQYVYLSKVITPPTKQTKDEGQFMMVSSGQEIWTKFYYKTRKATEKEIKIGTQVIAFEAMDNESVYRAPESRDEMTSYNWFMAKITDVSDLYKGFVTVSGDYKVRLDNMRVIVK